MGTYLEDGLILNEGRTKRPPARLLYTLKTIKESLDNKRVSELAGLMRGMLKDGLSREEMYQDNIYIKNSELYMEYCNELIDIVLESY